MPQIVLEYSSNVLEQTGFAPLFVGIHEILHERAGIRLDNCKSRALRRDEFYIGDGHPSNAFVHLDIRFIEGRSEDVKQSVGTASLKRLKQFFEKSMARLDLQITVELGDIQRSSYFKFPEGTLTAQ